MSNRKYFNLTEFSKFINQFCTCWTNDPMKFHSSLINGNSKVIYEGKFLICNKKLTFLYSNRNQSFTHSWQIKDINWIRLEETFVLFDEEKNIFLFKCKQIKRFLQSLDSIRDEMKSQNDKNSKNIECQLPDKLSIDDADRYSEKSSTISVNKSHRQLSNSSGDSGFNSINSSGGVYINRGKIFVSAIEPEYSELKDSENTSSVLKEDRRKKLLKLILGGVKRGKKKRKKKVKLNLPHTIMNDGFGPPEDNCTAIMENDEIIMAAFLATINKSYYELPNYSNDQQSYFDFRERESVEMGESGELQPFLIGAEIDKMPVIYWEDSLIAKSNSSLSIKGYNKISIFSSIN